MGMIIVPGTPVNSLLSQDLITNEALHLFHNRMLAVECFDNPAVNSLRQSAKKVQGFRYEKPAIGTIKIRRPNAYKRSNVDANN